MTRMKSRFARAAAALLLAGAPAHASPVMLSVGTTMYDGPGDTYAVLAMLDPGRIELGQCVINLKQQDWCWAKRDGQSGWIHVLIQIKSAPPPIDISDLQTGPPDDPSIGLGFHPIGDPGFTFTGQDADPGDRTPIPPTTLNLDGGSDRPTLILKH